MTDDKPVQVVSYGGGVNSCAMLIGLKLYGERPDAITFSDTGGEKPHTYQHLVIMQKWCEEQEFPSIQVLSGSMPQQIKDGTLENECLRLGTLPSKAYGFGSCSDKWKMDPYRKWERGFMRTYGLTESPLRLIGFHAGEPERVLRVPEQYRKYRRYPLIEWDWDYEDCGRVIQDAGLPFPGKSACFFCPSSKKPELVELLRRYPSLVARALKMERRALVGEGQASPSRCGLGRYFTWGDFFAGVPVEGEIEDCGENCFT